MRQNLARLLRGQLQSGGPWLLIAAAVQFLAASALWALGATLQPIPGIVVVALAACVVMRTDALAWRVLPIPAREIALARWCVTVTAPGIALTVAQIGRAHV